MSIACAKGLAAGSVSIVLALVAGAAMPSAGIVLQAGLLGFFGYGLSLTLFVVALRGLGRRAPAPTFHWRPSSARRWRWRSGRR